MNVKFRTAEFSDAKQLSQLYSELKKYELGLLSPEEKSIQQHWENGRTEEELIEEMGNENTTFILAEQGGELLGFVRCVIETACDGFKEGSLDIFVKSGYRGKGVGTGLLKRAEEHAKSRGCGSLSLAVYTRNERARKFYEKNSFFILSEGLKKVI